MKIASFSLLAVLGLCVPVFGQAPFQPGDLKVNKVGSERANHARISNQSGDLKRYKLGKWIEMEISFDTKKAVDELTFKYTVQLEGKLYDGEVTYASIAEGRDHYAVMYVSPKAIDGLLKGKPLTTAADRQCVGGCVEVRSKNGADRKHEAR
jgi:hypothetical protein